MKYKSVFMLNGSFVSILQFCRVLHLVRYVSIVSSPVISSFISTFPHNIYFLFKLPSITTHISNTSLLHLHGSANVPSHTVGHLVRFYGAASVGLDVIISILLFAAVLPSL